MIAIGCENISLAYGTDVILDGITFSINEGDKVGVVGVNGAGKTTLFKFLCGENEPDTGSVFRCKGKTIGYLKRLDILNSTLNTKAKKHCLTIFIPVISHPVPTMQIFLKHTKANISADVAVF